MSEYLDYLLDAEEVKSKVNDLTSKMIQQGKSERRYLIKEDGSIHNLDEDIERAYQQGRADAIEELKPSADMVAYEQGRLDAIEEELQKFAQWLWDSHYLVDEAFTIRLVEQYNTEQLG